MRGMSLGLIRSQQVASPALMFARDAGDAAALLGQKGRDKREGTAGEAGGKRATKTPIERLPYRRAAGARAKNARLRGRCNIESNANESAG